MTLQRPLRVFSILLLATLVFTPAAAAEKPSHSGFPRSVSLPGGGTITVATPPVRICSVTVATDEILLELVGPDRIVALSNLVDNPVYSNVVAEAAAVPRRVGSEAEQVIGLRPDLVLVAFYTRAEFVRLLEAAALPVVRLDQFDTLPDIRANIRLMGILTGTEPKAEELITGMDRRIDRVRSLVSGRPAPSVLVFAHGWVAGKGTLYHEIVEVACGLDLAAEKDIEGHEQISIESILVWNPDYILTDGPAPRMSHGGRLTAANPVLANLAAIREGKVIEVPSAHLFSCASHHIVNGIEELARLLHPEVFPSPAEDSDHPGQMMK